VSINQAFISRLHNSVKLHLVCKTCIVTNRLTKKCKIFVNCSNERNSWHIVRFSGVKWAYCGSEKKGGSCNFLWQSVASPFFSIHSIVICFLLFCGSGAFYSFCTSRYYIFEHLRHPYGFRICQKAGSCRISCKLFSSPGLFFPTFLPVRSSHDPYGVLVNSITSIGAILRSSFFISLASPTTTITIFLRFILFARLTHWPAVVFPIDSIRRSR
jgi:hypothetical protein